MSEFGNTLRDEKKSDPEKVGDLPVRSEKLGFDREELLTCSKCARTNSPDRFECIYCGTVLGLDDVKAKVSIDRIQPELWENGFNVVFISTTGDYVNFAKVGKLVHLDPELVTNFLQVKGPLPLARFKSRNAAEMVGERLAELGVRQVIVADSDLRPADLPVRLRGLEFGSAKITLIDFNTSRKIETACSDIELIVIGKHLSARTELSEERRKKKEPKILSETETSSDESLIDIYIRGDALGFRISSTGFDFSCLGAEKTLLAGENMKQLSAKLRETAIGAKYIDNYNQNIDRLSEIWQMESRKDTYGLQRSGFARKAFESVATSNNLNQFTKFSRLNRILNEA